MSEVLNEAVEEYMSILNSKDRDNKTKIKQEC